jgi:hypothetical protein
MLQNVEPLIWNAIGGVLGAATYCLLIRWGRFAQQWRSWFLQEK